MKTIRKFSLIASLIACLFFTSCNDDSDFDKATETAKINAEKILSYGKDKAIFKSSTKSTSSAQLFKIETPFITFWDDDDDVVTLPLYNLLNVSYSISSQTLVLYFE